MIEINNLTSIALKFEFFKKIAEFVLKKEKPEKKFFFSLAFIGEKRMRKLNYKYRGKNRITDVLAFPEAEIPFEKWKIGELKKTKNLGEIVICPREVKKNARRFNLSFEKELARVLIHGILHLLGYDHEVSKKKAEEMRKKEEIYLNQIINQINC